MTIYDSQNVSSFFLIKGLWSVIKRKRKFQLFILSVLMFISSVVESLTLASIIPLLNLFNKEEFSPNLKIIDYCNKLILIRNGEINLINK